MIITNQYNLPESFVQLARREHRRTPGRYSVTELLKGVRETVLLRRYGDQVEVDVADMVWMLFGQAAHYMLEKQQEADTELAEERLEVPVGGYILSGRFDLYDDATKTVTDYKTTSVWKVIFGNFEDWWRQLLIYAWMLRQIGFNPEHGQVVAFLRDHSKREAGRKADYPKLPVYKHTFSFSPKDFWSVGGWIETRLAEIKTAVWALDGDLPLCTPEERFNSGDKWAVTTPERKKALRVLDSEIEAMEWAIANAPVNYRIERRPGEDTKCRHYCMVRHFCDYYREHVAEEV